MISRDRAAVCGQYRRDAPQRRLLGRRVGRVGRAQRGQRREPPGSRLQAIAATQKLGGAGGAHPPNARSDHIPAQQRKHPRPSSMNSACGACHPLPTVQSLAGQMPPGDVAPRIGAAGLPPLLPGLAWLLLQPARTLTSPARRPADSWAVHRERRREQPRQDHIAALLSRRPRPLRTAGREPVQQRRQFRACLRRSWTYLRRRPASWSRGTLAEQDVSVSGRYTGTEAPPAGGDAGPAPRRAWWASTLAITSSGTGLSTAAWCTTGHGQAPIARRSAAAPGRGPSGTPPYAAGHATSSSRPDRR